MEARCVFSRRSLGGNRDGFHRFGLHLRERYGLEVALLQTLQELPQSLEVVLAEAPLGHVDDRNGAIEGRVQHRPRNEVGVGDPGVVRITVAQDVLKPMPVDDALHRRAQPAMRRPEPPTRRCLGLARHGGLLRHPRAEARLLSACRRTEAVANGLGAEECRLEILLRIVRIGAVLRAMVGDFMSLRDRLPESVLMALHVIRAKEKCGMSVELLQDAEHLLDHRVIRRSAFARSVVDGERDFALHPGVLGGVKEAHRIGKDDGQDRRPEVHRIDDGPTSLVKLGSPILASEKRRTLFVCEAVIVACASADAHPRRGRPPCQGRPTSPAGSRDGRASLGTQQRRHGDPGRRRRPRRRRRCAP
mmetsp:Transcript_52542/g.153108  ORF Transcript_52542/g.153108 Transcript_52542/m.153108 type:complete len:361 (-) Transcript_52542:198-1280(-)